MKKQKYFDGFGNLEDVIRDFEIDTDLNDRNILFASYATEAYEGSAFVLFKRDKKLYEVNGSHCSCYGLEGQWEPEETSWDALAMRIKVDATLKGSNMNKIRVNIYGVAPEGVPYLVELIKKNVKVKDAV